MNSPRIALLVIAIALLGGCASTYQLTLMPRTRGKLYYGEAVEKSGASQADVSVTIEDKTYTGTWVYTVADRTSGYLVGGFWGWRRSGLGTVVSVDNPAGGEAKALLQAPDGSGLRCDFKGLGVVRGGGGTCQDDKGLLYDVQIRLKENK
jgi:uncharacterized protein YceK